MPTTVKFTYKNKTSIREDERNMFQVLSDFVKWNEKRKLQVKR